MVHSLNDVVVDLIASYRSACKFYVKTNFPSDRICFIFMAISVFCKHLGLNLLGQIKGRFSFTHDKFYN